jgi:hypothetical protein
MPSSNSILKSAVVIGSLLTLAAFKAYGQSAAYASLPREILGGITTPSSFVVRDTSCAQLLALFGDSMPPWEELKDEKLEPYGSAAVRLMRECYYSFSPEFMAQSNHMQEYQKAADFFHELGRRAGWTETEENKELRKIFKSHHISA